MRSEVGIKTRIRSIRRLLSKKKLNCLIITKPANVTYTTGFSGEDSWAVIAPRSVYLVTDSRYTEQAQSECQFCRIIERKRPLAAAIAKLLDKLRTVERVGVEKSTSVAGFTELKKNVKAGVRTAEDIVEQVRISKDSEEVAAIRAAAGIAARVLRQTRRYIKPGRSENELAGRLDFEIRKLGACNCFETIVAFGPNASRAHHQPTGRKLRKNDTVLIDFGARYRNYCCDLTRCFAVGKTSALYKKVYKAVQEAQEAAIKMVKAGVDIKRLDTAARQAIKRHALPVYGHGTGHGLGLEVHELPVVSKQGKGKLKAGTVFTVEPGVYMPGKLGVRIEDDVLVTETGCDVLSSHLSNQLMCLE
ncbi:MAG: M24 family metallopeptidase [Planctomycetota bacterium]|jgi:Xaa-Pro aminopeptidase